MQCETKPFVKVERKYTITETELKQALKMKGKIQNIVLYSGPVPSEDIDPVDTIWQIETEEFVPRRKK